MKPLLIIGPDSTLRDTTALAKEIWPNRRIEGLYIPSKDYYQFDFSELVNYRSSEWCICVAVNEFYINDVRRAMYESLAAMDYEFVSLISPGAHVSASALIGVNTIIHAGCFVGANTTIGDLNSFSGGLGYNFGMFKLDFAYTNAQRNSQQPFFNQGFTDGANIKTTNNNFTMTLLFEM